MKNKNLGKGQKDILGLDKSEGKLGRSKAFWFL